jgi:sugar/nucleoside kinase (ribokinase family)
MAGRTCRADRRHPQAGPGEHHRGAPDPACPGVQRGRVDDVDGPFVAKPLITTGPGDHFNSGFVLGKLLGLSNAQALLCGVSTSGFYVRTGQSPSGRRTSWG